MFDDLGIDGGHITIVGAVIAALTWMWKKISGMGDKIAAMELKIAENYVTRPEFKALEDKLDKHNEVVNGKIDRVNDNLITLTNLFVKNK